ncbi:hypothetical protein HFO04_32830 [Rhizobium laguerreae]|uniref:hypothetical protein n=1 Tax=Rhizobium laguerreae TaxID=1076926 RepID=UPI001C9246F0|nr:hypothetical protein [Rhizobium laguerreae]MBY3307518.1 hypothetical protein [Rhizobium laguerreae]
MISDSGQPVEATFEVVGDGSNFTLVFKADGGSGKNRLNRDYGLGLEILMRRLSSISVSLDGAYLDSSLARKLELEERRLGPAAKIFLPDADARALCSWIRREAATFNVPGARKAQGKAGKNGGNQTRRLRLELSTPVAYDLSTLRAYLENGFGGEIERMQMAPGETVGAFTRWLEMLRTGEQVGEETWYFASHNVRVKIGPRLVNGVPIARFAEGRRGKHWIVEINPPRFPKREDGLSTIAIDSLKRRWLLRQGTLHENQLSERIDDGRFSELTGLKSVHLEGAERRWYPVEMLDFAAAMPFGTLEFVARCALARGGGSFLPADVVELFGVPEIAQSYIIPASITSEREVRRRQGEVWHALERLTRGKGGELRKPRHARGYEVDGLFRLRSRSVLIEIKTTTRAADIYTGVGQLLLYREIIPKLADAELVLLLPGHVALLFVDALSSHGVRILTYRLDPERPCEVEWPTATLKHLGLL